MGFTEVLTTIFIVLKLLNIINWNWFFVLLPEIIALAIYLVIIIVSIFQYRAINKEFKQMKKKIKKEMKF